MKMNFIHTLAVTAALSFCSCTEIEDGSPINFDEWEAPEKIEFTLNHPCMLHSEAEFAYVKEKLAASAQPWAYIIEKQQICKPCLPGGTRGMVEAFGQD